MNETMTSSPTFARESFSTSSAPWDSWAGSVVVAAALEAAFGAEDSDSCAPATAAHRLDMTQAVAAKTMAETHRIFITSAFPYDSTVSEQHRIVKLLSSAAPGQTHLNSGMACCAVRAAYQWRNAWRFRTDRFRK